MTNEPKSTGSGRTFSPRPRRLLLLGATGTIGAATARALVARGHQIVCVIRPRPDRANRYAIDARLEWPEGATTHFGDVTDPATTENALRDHGPIDAIISCLASRTGAPDDAWAIDYQAHLTVLEAAQRAGVNQMVLLSAICVQKPLLAFQHAKLDFEKALVESGLTYSIVRPTAFFKSLSGQIARVRRGKPFLLFGDGELTACKPISDSDLAEYIALCLDDPDLQNRILPIGGPGPAITPREQGNALFGLIGMEPRFRSVSPALLTTIASVLAVAGRLAPKLKDKAELANIGHYYATESMLVLDPVTGRYDAEATPSFGKDTLFDHYARIIAGETMVDLGDHAVF